MESFNFLVTTDNHLGFKEDDHLRRKDSYKAFEEALRIARERDVDFILLGGDLFHNNRPSANIEHKCIKIIRQHMNAKVDRGTSFKLVKGNFSHFRKLNHPNFEDDNFIVPYPIMTIHGNHDDPTGPNAKSVCEKLATCGLLNYFGAVALDSKNIKIEPIVLQKGKLKIALYGLGFIPDFKLKQYFDRGEIEFVQPPEDTFNVLVIHQNRIPFNKNKYIADELLPTFFHLVIRGHEHSTLSPEPMPNSKVEGIVYQPGSTVATSISTMEAAPKKIGLITVMHDPSKLYKMDHELIELKSCRRMIFKDIGQKEIRKGVKKLSARGQLSSAEYRHYSRCFIEQCITALLEEYNSKAKDLVNGVQESQPDLPLLRVRLEYVNKNERFDELDISSKFYPSNVANKDIVLYRKQKLRQTEEGEVENITFIHDADEDEDQEEDFESINLGEEKRDSIDVMIECYFKDKPDHLRLQALSLIEYTNAVRGSSEDGNVISKVLNKKKKDIFTKYQAALLDEEHAQLKFNNEDSVRDWFLSAFGNQVNKEAGDECEMEIVICD